MNTTVSVNHTSRLYECFDSYHGIVILLFSLLPDLIIFLPLHVWTLSVFIRKLKKEKVIPPSDFFTVALSLMEIFSSFGFFMCVVSIVFNITWTMYVAVVMLGKYLIGRPVMNCLICLELLIAVVYPVLFHKFSTLRLRCACFVMALLVTWFFAIQCIFTFPEIPLQMYSPFLIMRLLCITACSLRVLKALLKTSPGNKEKEVTRKKKTRAFRVLTNTLTQLFLSYFLLLVTSVIKTVIPFDTFCLLSAVSMWFLRPSSAIQPVLYLSKYNKLPCIKKT